MLKSIIIIFSHLTSTFDLIYFIASLLQTIIFQRLAPKELKSFGESHFWHSICMTLFI